LFYTDILTELPITQRWWRYMPGSLERFDLEVRDLLRDNRELVPEGLSQFMRYADRHGLFTAYRETDVTLFALAGIGTRLSRPNPWHRVVEIWPELAPEFRTAFRQLFPLIQSDVLDWRERMSTTTGS
jgi:acyl carrier protein phosphodiesterase